MQTYARLSILFVLAAALSFAQTVTPNTTLCAALSASSTTVCLASTTGVVNQTGFYIDQEYLVATLSASQTVGPTNAYVPVTRGNRAAGSGPQAHANGSVVWVALTPSNSIVPGANGFSISTAQGDIGTCTRTAQIYLPHIFPSLQVIRDCVNGVWVDFNQGLGQKLSPIPLSALSASGAVTPGTGDYVITKAGVAALTLAAPTAGIQDGTIIQIASSTAFAHTLTATGLFQTGTASVNLATFAANAGASVTLIAFNGKWIVLSSTGITFS